MDPFFRSHLPYRVSSIFIFIFIFFFDLDTVVSVIIDGWAKLKYARLFFPSLARSPGKPEPLPYISVNTASAVILTLGSCRAYLFWLFSTWTVWLTVVVRPWDIVQS